MLIWRCFHTVWGQMKPSKGTVPQIPPARADAHLTTHPCLPLPSVKEPASDSALHSHRWVHLLFTVGVREGGLNLPVARLQAVHERWHSSHGHRVMLHRVPHIWGMQILPLMWHNLGGLLTVQHREIRGHVDIHIVHGPFRQATVGL